MGVRRRFSVVLYCTVGLLCVGGLLAYLQLRPINLRRNLGVPEPCLGNTAAECTQKCGQPIESGTFQVGSALAAYQVHSYGQWTARVFFYDNLAHMIMYTQGPVMSSGLVRLSPLDEDAKDSLKHLASVNLKGDRFAVDDNGQQVTYQGERSGISVMTLPLMSNVIIASTQLAEDTALLEAYNKERTDIPARP